MSIVTANGSKTSAKTLIGEYLREVGEPRSLQDIAARTDLPYGTVSAAVKVLAEKDGTVARVSRGLYQWNVGPAELVTEVIEPDAWQPYTQQSESEWYAGPAPAAIPPELITTASRTRSMVGARLDALGYTDAGILILRDAAGLLYTATRLTV